MLYEVITAPGLLIDQAADPKLERLPHGMRGELIGFLLGQLPQVVRATIPALINETVDIIKNSSLISTIAVTELMRVAQQYSSTTYRPIEFFTAAGLLYLVLTVSVGRAGRWLEQRLSHH